MRTCDVVVPTREEIERCIGLECETAAGTRATLTGLSSVYPQQPYWAWWVFDAKDSGGLECRVCVASRAGLAAAGAAAVWLQPTASIHSCLSRYVSLQHAQPAKERR